MSNELRAKAALSERRRTIETWAGAGRALGLTIMACCALVACIAEVPAEDGEADPVIENELALALDEGPRIIITDPPGDSRCQVASDPDCGPQPHRICGYTGGNCPAGKHSVYRACVINCGDYAFGASSPCAPDRGANTILCEDDTQEFYTCDLSCPTDYRTVETVSNARCGDRRTQSRLCRYQPPPPPPAEFLLRHVGGSCVHPLGGQAQSRGNTPAVLYPLCTREPRLALSWTSAKSLQNPLTKACLQPESGGDRPAVGTRLVYNTDCGSRLDQLNGNKKRAFELTAGGSLRHIHSGLCVHPRGGSATPGAETELVLWNSCDEPRLRFQSL